jgi:lysine-ketoglutarate reductase/saccharopine dehydrogenase-like protein (TIGR00300 family)
MKFLMPEYTAPDFDALGLRNISDAMVGVVVTPGVAPANFHATTIFPEYFRVGGEWLLLEQSRMDGVVVLSEDNRLEVKEFRRLAVGDRVVVGRSEDGREGIYVHANGFRRNDCEGDTFAFRTGRSRETAYSRDYDRLYELLRFEKEHGYTVWVLGPAVVFDSDSKKAMISLIENGYVDAILAGNALATHDLEGAIFQTALGQDIYTQESCCNGHYHHLDVLNQAREHATLAEFVAANNIADSVVAACVRTGTPMVLAGSIRDDGPLPEVLADAYAAQNAMRQHAKQATTMICLATQLHSIASGNMTPAYQVVEGNVRPVFLYSVDVSEFAVNKLKDRGSLEVTSIVTNIQDFLVHIQRELV